MKKIKYLLILTTFLILKNNVYATNLGVSINCPSTAYSNTTINCSLSASVSDGLINGINANYSFKNSSYQNFSANSSFSIYNSTSNGFAIGNTNGFSGGNIGNLTVYISGEAGSSATVGITNIGASDTSYNDISVSDKYSTINIIEKPIPVTTTRKKIVYLSELSVDGYDINFNRNTFNYTLDVDYEVTKLKINASSANGYEISGIGDVIINEGENILNIKVSDKDGESSTYQIKVNRVVKVSNIVNNNIEEMTNAFKSNNELIINLDKNTDSLIVTKSMLDLIMNNKKKLIYNILENKEILYSFIFDGSKLNNSFNDINLDLDFKNNKEDVIKDLLNDKKLIYFKTKHSKYFPDGTILKIKNITKYHQESKLRLFKLNEENSLELISKNIKINDNFIEFKLENGGNYILSSNNTKSKNISLIIIISSCIIFLELILIGWLLIRKKNSIKIPKIDKYLENPDFLDDDEK